MRAGLAPFILCVDADDFLHPEFLSATLETIESQRVDCAYAEFQLVGLANGVWPWDLKTPDALAEVQWVPGPGVVMRRSVWEAVGGYSEELLWNEDWDFWIGVIHLGFSFGRVPRPLYFYRRHAQSMTATLSAMSDGISREVILKKRAEFFAIGNRASTFRAGGLLRTAYAHRARGLRWQSILLTARAILVNRKLLFSESKAAVRRKLDSLRKVKRRMLSVIKRTRQIYSPTRGKEISVPRDWDLYAPIIHNRYGYLSYDFSVLGHVIDKVRARAVLEIGCGSGKLVPVYLTHNVQTLCLQDVSEQALDLCRHRFFCQKHIRYFLGNVQSLSISAIDLIVANRVLQHILEDRDFNEVIQYLAPITRYFYINEPRIEEAASRGDPYLKGRDYIQIFGDLGYQIADQGELIAEFGTRQRWMLFIKEETSKVALCYEPGSTVNVQ